MPIASPLSNAAFAKNRGSKKVSVNLSTEKATVEVDSNIGSDRLIDRVRRAGYGVAIGEAHFLIENLSENNDALVIEKRILTHPGVLRGQVNVSTSTLRIEFLPTATNQVDLKNTLRTMGFKVSDAGTAEDAEALARKKELTQQRRFLTILH